MTLILNDDDVAKLLNMSQCIAALEDAFLDLGRGQAINVPRNVAVMPGQLRNSYYQFKSLSGGMVRSKVFVQRSDSDFLLETMVDGEPRVQKLPRETDGRYVGLVFLYSSETLELLAIFTDGHMQRLRVAGTTGVGVKALARSDAETAAVLGTGWQAEVAVWALDCVRRLNVIRVYSPNREHLERFVPLVQQTVSARVVPVNSIMDAMKGADIVAAATNSRNSVIPGNWLEQGMHVSTVMPTEADEQVWERADLVVCSSPPADTNYYRPSMTATSPFTEKATGIERDRWERYRNKVYELSALLAGKTPVRASPDDITYFNKNWGLGIEFAALARLAYDLAVNQKIGQFVPTEWFTQASHP